MRRLLDEVGLKTISSGKLTVGIDAIHALVQSEINNFNVNVHSPSSSSATRLLRHTGALVTRYAWAAQLRLWRRLYRFERIHIDSVIVATRGEPPRPHAES